MRYGLCYLGYDFFGDIYKLLWIEYRDDYGFWVLILGDKELWRMIKVSILMCGLMISWKCISGVIYYEVIIIFSNNNGLKNMEIIMMSFNVRFEMFKLIKFLCCVDNI